jgi:ABC-type Fe3+/spermidine/putrescine transport system ATPase subunit
MMALADLQRRAGFMLIMATRDADSALAMADRIAVMAEGRILQIGTPQALYDRPEHSLVAALTGPVNLIAGTARAGAIEVADLGDLPADTGALLAGSPAVLSLRPDLIELSLTPPADEEICLKAEVRDVVYSGGGLKVRLLSGRHGLVARIDGRRLTTHDLPPGRQIWCTWDRRAAQVMAT